jgi:[ribosomal protein S18]-alanine N-acetyltransferase
MTSALLVRSANPGDIAAMHHIAAHAATASEWSLEQYNALFTPESPRRVALVIEEQGMVKGFIVGRVLGPDWEIENIAVTGDARRRGLGSRMLGEFIALARKEGATTVMLEVRESNQAARMLYEKWAFQESGRRKAYYSNPAEDAILLTFSLA